MKCPECNIEIACRAEKCPLCQTELPKIEGEKFSLQRAFPKRGKTPLLSTSLFDILYVVIALNITIVALITEIIIGRSAKITFIIFCGLFYLYFLIRSTIQETNYFSQKVVAQAIALSIIAFSLRNIIPNPIMIYEYVLPIIYLISMIMIAVYIITRFKRSRKHLINLMSVALLGFFPFAVVMISGTPNIVMCTISAVLGGVIILTTLAFSTRKIINEIKRIFDV